MPKGIYINQAAYVKDTLNLSGGTLTGVVSYNGDLSNNFSGDTLITKDYADLGVTSLSTALSTEISTTDSEVTSLSSAFGDIDFTSLENELSTEISTRGSEDTSLSTEITSLDTALSTEISSTDGEVTSLDTALSTEISSTDGEVTSLSTAIGNYSTTLEGLTDTSIDTPVEGNLLIYDNDSSKWINTNTINKDVTIIGDLYVSGTTVTMDVADMNVADNIILVNSGETGSGVSLIYAGIEVDRGSLDNYRFVLDDTVTSNPLFKVGAIGDYQAVATRQDSPNSSGVTYWNDTIKRFDTSTSLLFDGTTLKYGSTITLVNDVDIAHKKYVDDSITGITSLDTALSTEISTTDSEITSLESVVGSTELGDLSGITLTGLQELDVLIYSGGTWVNNHTEDGDSLFFPMLSGTSLDTALSTEISTTDSEVTSLITEITSLDTALSTEISTTDSEVTSLSTEITSLDTALSTEISTTDSEVTSLSSAITNNPTSLSGLTDTTISELAEGDVLIYSGGTWINDTTVEMDSLFLNLSGGTITGSLTVIDYYYMGDENTDGSWRWFINVDGDLEFQKRISTVWTYKTKLT